MWSSVIISDGEAAVGSVSGVTVLPAGQPQALAELIETLGETPVETPGVPVLLVHAHRAYESWLRTAVTLAAGRWPDLRLAWRAGDHAPLATLSALSAARLQDAEPALAVRLVDRLLEHSWSGAWVTSVARLGRPAPSLAQHARSLLPGSSFLVRHHPQPAVLAPTVTDPVPADDLQASGHERVLLVQSQRRSAPSASCRTSSGSTAAPSTTRRSCSAAAEADSSPDPSRRQPSSARLGRRACCGRP